MRKSRERCKKENSDRLILKKRKESNMLGKFTGSPLLEYMNICMYVCVFVNDCVRVRQRRGIKRGRENFEENSTRYYGFPQKEIITQLKNVQCHNILGYFMNKLLPVRLSATREMPRLRSQVQGQIHCSGGAHVRGKW